MTVRNTLPLLLIALFSGCSNSFIGQRMDQGVIEYALTFPDYDPDGLMAGMLPERTTLTFSKDIQVAELSAGMGVFRTSMITDNHQRKMDYHLTVLSKKLVSHMRERDVSYFNKDQATMVILLTEGRDTIAGYPCRKAVAISTDLSTPEIELWFTDRIEMTSPNWYGPFSEIPGVLLRYEMVQYGMRMQLNAISVSPGPVDPVKFAVKADHQAVPPEVLHHELEEVLSTFSL